MTCSVGEERGALSEAPRSFAVSHCPFKTLYRPGGSGPRGRGSPAMSAVQGHRRERWDVTPDRGTIVEGEREPVLPNGQGTEAYL